MNPINLPTALIGSSSMASLPSPTANRQATERDASCASAVKRQRLANSDWQIVGVAISHDGRRQPRQKRRAGWQSANRQVGKKRQRMANSDGRLGKRKLIVGVAISHDGKAATTEDGGQVGSRQIGRSENGSE
jgi:hypothetical protein